MKHILLLCLFLFLFIAACAAPMSPSSTPTSLALTIQDTAATASIANANATEAVRQSVIATQVAAEKTAVWQAKLDEHAFQVTEQADALAAAINSNNATAQAKIKALQVTAELDRANAAAAEAAARIRAAQEWEDAKRHAAQVLQDAASAIAVAAPIIVVVTLLALACIAIYFFFEREQIKTTVYHHVQWQLVERAKSETREVVAKRVNSTRITIRGIEYIWDEEQGYYVPILRELADGGDLNLKHEWRSALKRLVYAGIELGGFGERRLTEDNPVVLNPVDHQPSSENCRLLLGMLIGMGVLVAPKGKETRWAPGWSAERFERDFDALPLPELPNKPIPEVRVPLRTPADQVILPHSRTPAPIESA
jgi:hypothetical protein